MKQIYNGHWFSNQDCTSNLHMHGLKSNWRICANYLIDFNFPSAPFSMLAQI